jgi:hypothetical protein
MRQLLAASVVVTVALVALSALDAGASPDTTATTTARAVAGSADAGGATNSLPTYFLRPMGSGQGVPVPKAGLVLGVCQGWVRDAQEGLSDGTEALRRASTA